MTRPDSPKTTAMTRAEPKQSDEATVSTPVRVLGREYQISCPESEQEALLASARLLDRNMRKIKSRDGIQDTETVAVIAALNITNDTLRKNRQISEAREMSARQVRELVGKVAAALRQGSRPAPL